MSTQYHAGETLKKGTKTIMKRSVKTLSIEEIPNWISKSGTKLLTQQKFNDLLRFYIINTPDSKKSARGKTIADYGIDELDFLNGIKKEIVLWESSGNGVIVESKFELALLKDFPPLADFSERVCFGYSCKTGELTSLFGHIRNSLAHGRFNIVASRKDPVLVMEDRNSNGNCSARMLLRLSTLMRWKEEIEKK